MNHYFKCKQVIKDKHSPQEFEKHLAEFLKESTKDKEDDLLSVLLKDTIVNHLDHFQFFFDLLVKKGADINFVDKKSSKSLLMTACEAGTKEAVRELLKEKVNTEHRDQQNKTCLFYALENNMKTEALQILRMILEENSELVHINAGNNRSILVAATEKEKIEFVRLILEKGANPNVATSDTLDTPLHKVVRNLSIEKKNRVLNEKKEIIRLLLNYGADPGIRNKQGKTAVEVETMLADIIASTPVERIVVEPPSQKAPSMKEKSSASPKEENRKEKQSPRVSRQRLVLDASNRISNLKQSIKQLEKSIEQIQLPKPVQTIPISNLYIRDFQLEVYLSQQLKDFANTIETQKLTLQPIVDRVIESIKSKLSSLNVTLILFGSQATHLNLMESDINIAVYPLDKAINSSDRIKLMTSVEMLLKELKSATEVKNIRERSIIKATFQEGGRVMPVNIQMASLNNVEEQSIKLIQEYLELYPSIKPLNYLVKIMLANMGIINNPNGGLGSYGLLVLICAYVKAQHQIQEEILLTTGELLIGFLNTFGFEFDYIDKTISLYKDKGYAYTLGVKYAMEPKLIISDPLNESNDIGALPSYTKFIQHLFKVSYLSLRINDNCQHQCASRQRIQALTDDRLVYSVRPCCLLKRMFKSQGLLR